MTTLPVINLTEARFECVYGRGCDGLCCTNGRPPVSPKEQQTIEENLSRFFPLLRPEAQKVVEKSGFVSGRRKMGLPMLRVVEGWCVFFNEGCVLHKVGAEEGNRLRYKPVVCALFPLDQDNEGSWFVRQKDYAGEQWDLFCLNPGSSDTPAAESLADEIALAHHLKEEGAMGPYQPNQGKNA